MAGALALPLTLASFGPAANDAYAGEANAATPAATTPGERGLDAVQGMRDMRHYSEDPATRGIGVFINLQKDAPEGYGNKIGKKLQEVFATRNIPVQYRLNQSRGTATDITFYVQGIDFTVNIDDIGANLPTILAHHNDVWLPGKTASLGPEITQQ